MDLDVIAFVVLFITIAAPLLIVKDWGTRLTGRVEGQVRPLARFLYAYAALVGLALVAVGIWAMITAGMPEVLVLFVPISLWVLWVSWRRLQVARRGIAEERIPIGRLAGRIIVILAIPFFGLLGALFLAAGGSLLAERAYLPALFAAVVGGLNLYSAGRLLVTSVQRGIDSAASSMLRVRRPG